VHFAEPGRIVALGIDIDIEGTALEREVAEPFVPVAHDSEVSAA
jgi:hypothetical protein